MSALATFAPLAWQNLWRNPRRTVITLIVVSIGLWSVLFFNSFLTAWGESRKEEVLGLLIGAGTLLGGLLASATIVALSGGIDLSRFAAGLEMFQSGQVICPGFAPAAMVKYALAIWALGVLVALWPARRAARLAPVEAMRQTT